jgi:hypothetical protein
MQTVSDTRYAELTAIDTDVAVFALGGTTATPYVVPPEGRYIIGFNVQYSSDGAAAGSSGGVASLSGPGLEGTITPVRIPLGTFGAELTTVHSTPARTTFIPTNMPCLAGLEINCDMRMVGEDTGSSVGTLEIVYSDTPRAGYPKMRYDTLETQPTAVDTWIQLQWAGNNRTFTPSTKDRQIVQILTTAVMDAAGTGSSGMAGRFTGSGVKGTDQVFALDGGGGTNATEANGHVPVTVRDLAIAVNGNQPITPEVMLTGADTGSGTVLVGVGYAV